MNSLSMRGEDAQRRQTDLHDGKLLAETYPRTVRSKEADTVHAITRMLRTELHDAMKRREAEILQIGSRMGGIETLISPIKEDLSKMLATAHEQAEHDLKKHKSIFAFDHFLPSEATDAHPQFDGLHSAANFLNYISPFNKAGHAPDTAAASSS